MTPGAPSAVGDALRLLHARFLNRTDLVAIHAPWGKPFPVDANRTLDDLLLAHLLGEAAPVAKVAYSNRRGAGVMAGHYRVGSYSPATDGTTRWVCLDFDGAGHANALADPQAAALGYTPDATKTDKAKFPKYAAPQACGNCALYQGAAGAASGPCPLYAGKAVAAKGWCSAWVKKG